MAKTRKSETASPKPPKADAPLAVWSPWHFDNGAQRGYSVTAARPGEKAAYLPNWSKAPFKTRAEVERHWRDNPNDNIALVPRPGHFWLDADNLDVLEAFEAKHGELPVTYTQRSINGSLHFLFKGDVLTSPTVHFGGRKLGEIRGANSGQCIGAGSRGTDRKGKPGTWTVEDHSPTAASPKAVLALIGSRGKSAKDKPRQDHGDPTPWDHEQAKRLVDFVWRGQLLKEYVGPFQEGERDGMAFKLFAEAKGRGIHPDAIFAAVVDVGIDGGLDDDS